MLPVVMLMKFVPLYSWLPVGGTSDSWTVVAAWARPVNSAREKVLGTAVTPPVTERMPRLR